jgi:hypothetical protein
LNEFHRTAFSLSPQSPTSGVVKSLGGAVCIRLLSREAASEEKFLKSIDTYAADYLRQKAAGLFQDWYTELVRGAEIEKKLDGLFRRG